jgi:hypothetical protein
MGFRESLGRAKCATGIHAGDYTYDRRDSCDQTRVCSRCDHVSNRVRHNFNDWDWADADDLTSCRQSRVCLRCDSSEDRDNHSYEWIYPDYDSMAPGAPLLMQVLVGAVKEATPCLQHQVCARCSQLTGASRTYHAWGPWQLGRDETTSVRMCGRCREQETMVEE